jgi:5,10-methylene-tetrahydrofolate dehydrogenase/methenyl tetrahydrofolate cyclohydrolase
MALFLATLLCQSQNKLSLQIVEKSNQELSQSVHWYLLEVKNSSSKTMNAYVQTKMDICKNLDSRQLQTELEFEVFTESKQPVLKTLLIKPNGTSRFYVKSNHNSKTELGRWNCVEIALVNEIDQSVISETLELRSFIPNPRFYE